MYVLPLSLSFPLPLSLPPFTPLSLLKCIHSSVIVSVFLKAHWGQYRFVSVLYVLLPSSENILWMCENMAEFDESQFAGHQEKMNLIKSPRGPSVFYLHLHPAISMHLWVVSISPGRTHLGFCSLYFWAHSHIPTSVHPAISVFIAHAWSNHFSPLLLEGPKPPLPLPSTTARASHWPLFRSHSSVLFSGTTVTPLRCPPAASVTIKCLMFPWAHSLHVSSFLPFLFTLFRSACFLLSAPKGLHVASSRDTLVISIVCSGTHIPMSLLHQYFVFLPTLRLLESAFPLYCSLCPWTLFSFKALDFVHFIFTWFSDPNPPWILNTCAVSGI